MALNATERRFLQELVASRPAARRSHVAASLCRNFGLGALIAGHIEYSEADYSRARDLLLASGLPVQALGPEASRAQAASHGGMSEKSGTRGPHTNSVALKSLGGCRLDGHELWTPACGYLVCTIDDGVRIDADRVLLVENLEVFRNIEQYAWIATAPASVLVVFRGDRELSAADSTKLLARRSDPVWAFVDFDPAGLGIAAGVPRLERVVLPELPWLEGQLGGPRSLELFHGSYDQWRATLDSAPHSQIRAAWSLMKAKRAGLAQEAMLAYKPTDVIPHIGS